MPQSLRRTHEGAAVGIGTVASTAGRSVDLVIPTGSPVADWLGWDEGAWTGVDQLKATAWDGALLDDGHIHQSTTIAADAAARMIAIQMRNRVNLSGPDPSLSKGLVSVNFIPSTRLQGHSKQTDYITNRSNGQTEIYSEASSGLVRRQQT